MELNRGYFCFLVNASVYQKILIIAITVLLTLREKAELLVKYLEKQHPSDGEKSIGNPSLLQFSIL